MQLFQHFCLIFFSCLFSFEKEMAVNKYGHDTVQGLPVPIKPQRDHHNERWPWHNRDSSQQKPGSQSERQRRECFKKMNDVSWKHNINTTLTLRGNSHMLVGLRDLNLNVCDFLLRAGDVTVSLPAGILVLQMAKVKSWKILTERRWFGVVCTCSGWDNTQDACWEAHGLTTEMDNDSSLSGLSLCEAAW